MINIKCPTVDFGLQHTKPWVQNLTILLDTKQSGGFKELSTYDVDWMGDVASSLYSTVAWALVKADLFYATHSHYLSWKIWILSTVFTWDSKCLVVIAQ